MNESHRYKPFIVGLVVLALAAFVAMVWSFVLSVMTAAIFAGLLQPVYKPVARATGDRKALAAVVVVLLSLIAVGVPVFVVLVAAVGQGIEIGQRLAPLLSEQLGAGGSTALEFIPEWVPLADRIDAYQSQFIRNAGNWLSNIGGNFLVTCSPQTGPG